MSNYSSIDPSLYSDGTLLGDNGSAPIAPMSASPSNDLQLPQQSDVDQLLRKKRKAREHKACYPCRQRKVKCDLSRPCQTCRDREHPELCDYNPPNKRQALDQSSLRNDDRTNGGMVSIGRNEFDMLCQKLNGVEESIAELRRELGSQRAIDPALAARAVNELPQQHSSHNHTDLHGLHETNEAGSITHFGAGSIPTMLHAMKSPNDDATQRELRDQLNKSIMPLFGLDGDSTTYPFIDLWGLPHGSLARANELAKVLPDDQQALAFTRNYKSLAYVVFPGVANLERFEQNLHEFLVDRAAQVGSLDGVTEQHIYGKSYYWLGLLFAVLASGAQSSTMPRKQRELTSQVYLCCAVECCRFTNFLSRGNDESIQTLLIVQNVLSNNMSAGTAWTMLGLTIRLAQGQGFHQPCPPDVPTEHTFRRSRVWWAIVWQDSLLSIIYDRAGSEHIVCDKSMPMPMQYGEVSAYHQSMYKLAKVILDIVRDRGMSPNSHGTALSTNIERFHAEIIAILQSSADYLQDSRLCQTPSQSLEYWGLHLHSSFVIAELCRPSLDAARGAEAYRELCIQSLINTVDAYLGLQEVTSFARQSWAAVHRALSSALLLGILGKHNHSQRARHLLTRFITTMHEITTSIDPIEIAAPLQRGISALQKLTFPDSKYETTAPVAERIFADANGYAKLDNTVIPTLTPAATDSDEFSPHTILNTILWGVDGSAGNPMASPMPW